MIFGFVKNDILRSHNVLLQTVRYKRVNLRKPRPPHFQAQKVEAALSIQIPKPYDIDFPSFLKCRLPLVKERSIEEYPYERILANELLDNLNASKMILFFHRNPSSGEDYYGSKKTFKKAGMELLEYGKSTVRMAVENTKFSSILALFHSHTLILCGPEVKLNTAFDLIKKMPQYVLLAGIVEERFLHRNKLEEYSKLPNLDSARSQLISVLNASGNKLVNHLNYSQTVLVNNMNVHVKNFSA